jgi:hypothetical protein
VRGPEADQALIGRSSSQLEAIRRGPGRRPGPERARRTSDLEQLGRPAPRFVMDTARLALRIAE